MAAESRLNHEVSHERQRQDVLRVELPALSATAMSVLAAGLSVRRQVAAHTARWVHIRRAAFNIGVNILNKPMILVLCTGNSARSQMAEGFLRKFQGESFDVASAGTDPKPQVHPLAVRAMQEIGIDISDQKPKDLKAYLGRAPVRHILIVCDRANQSCPRGWPGAFTRTFMPFDDPAAATGSEAEKLAVFRRVRDEISRATQTWVPETPRAGK
jgi:arsenate reductase (thioredoxin)